MKPHEETWAVHPLDSRCVIRPVGRRDEGLVMADIREPLNENGREVAALIAAAPEMARALLGSGCVRLVGTPQEKWHTDNCWDKQECVKYKCLPECDMARAALTNAGVL